MTGASSGIGLAFAHLVAPRAKKLIMVARRVDKLEALRAELLAKHPKLEVVLEPCDLSKVDAAIALGTKVIAEHQVDVLINNAGVGDMSVFDKAELPRLLSMIELNVSSLVALTHICIGPMVERGRGGILNVSSGAGMTVMPAFAVYTATKHFVTGFTEVLLLDLAGTGVRVTQLCPGPVPTEFEATAGNFTGQSPPSFIEVTAPEAARAAIAGFDRGRAMVVPGFVFSNFMLVVRSTPRWVVRLVMKPIGKLLRKRQLAARPA